jgi:RHS repeat-associated protein
MGQLAAEYSATADAQQPACQPCYVTQDHLGSTRLLTSATGGQLARYDYLPFGGEINPPWSDRSTVSGYVDSDHMNPKFTGKPRDYESGLGLDYFGARYYSSAQGRFTSPDPLLNSGHPSDPRSWNRYTYTLNNPLKYTDPDGLWTWGKCTESPQECEAYRVQFEAGVNAARNALASGKLSKQERGYLQSVLKYLGSAADTKGPKVEFGAVKGPATGEMLTGQNTIRIDMAKLALAYLDPAVSGSGASEVNEVGGIAIHETRHLMDSAGAFDFRIHTGSEERKEFDLYRSYLAEQRAYNAESFVFKGLDAVDRNGLWNPSWVEADKETYRQAAVRGSAARSNAQIREEVAKHK